MKKKILLIVLPIILIIIIAIAVVAALYFTTDTFQSAEQLFWKNFASSAQVIDSLSNNNKNVQKEFKSANSYTSEGTATISSQIGNEASQSINISTKGQHDKNTGRTYAEATLMNGENELLKGTYINSSDVYAIKCDDVLPNYIGIRNSNLKEVAKMLDLGEEITNTIPDSIDSSSLSTLYTFTDAEKQHIFDTYSKVITETVGSDKYQKQGKEQVTVNGTNYAANKYTLTLNGDEVKQILMNCLAKLKEDSSTLVSISNRLAILGLNEDYTDITNLATRVDEMAVNIQNMTITNNITIDTYVYKGNAIKNVIDISELGKATIDINNTENNQKVILTLESYESNEAQSIVNTNVDVKDNTNVYADGENQTANTDVINMTVTGVTTNEQQPTDINTQQEETINSTGATNQVIQITLGKAISQTNIMNTIEISSDNQVMNYTSTLGNLQNNIITNSYTCSISSMTEGTNSSIDFTYDNTITMAEQVDEIIELTNSNAVIINNYQKEQIVPFLQAWFNKAIQVINSKIQIAGVNTNNISNEQLENGTQQNPAQEQ